MNPVRIRTLLVGVSAAVASLVLVGAPTSQMAGADARTEATSAPKCTFDGSSLPIVPGVTAGDKVAIACTGLAPLHPYLLLETNLVLGIDPNAAPLLSGNIVSLAGLFAALAALPEINLQALASTFSGFNGDLDYSYTLPTSQAIDPNASCPPSTQEFNSELIGCGLAMIDLTTFKTVGAGSAVIQYKGEPLLAPAPTLRLSTASATDGQSVAVSDAPGATTYWWVSTLYALSGLLGGGGGPSPTVTVTLRNTKTKASVTAPNTITVSPANVEPTFTPPKISGSFVPPAGLHGKYTVTVSYVANLLSFPLSNSVTLPIKLAK